MPRTPMDSDAGRETRAAGRDLLVRRRARRHGRDRRPGLGQGLAALALALTAGVGALPAFASAQESSALAGASLPRDRPLYAEVQELQRRRSSATQRIQA